MKKKGRKMFFVIVMCMCLLILVGCNKPPYPPEYIFPQDRDTHVSIQPTLSWNCSDPDGDPIVYNIYFGKDSAKLPPIQKNYSDTNFELDTLDYGSVYYWQIEAIDTFHASTLGKVSEFRTVQFVNLPDQEADLSISLPDQEIFINDTLNIDLTNYVTNSDEAALIFTMISGVGEIINGSTYTYSPSSAGSYEVGIRVTDGVNSAEDSFAITVYTINLPPSLSIPHQEIYEGDCLNINLSEYTDNPDGDNLVYSLISGVGSINGSFYTYIPDYFASGTYQVTIGVTDEVYSSQELFIITVYDQPNPKEIEPNNDFGQAQEIIPDLVYHSVSINYNDKDFYQFNAIDNNIILNFQHVNVNSSYSDFIIHVYNYSHTLIHQYTSENGLDSNYQFGTNTGDKYFIRINGMGSGTGGGYKFSISFGSEIFEIEPNDDFNQALKINEYTEYFGESLHYNDEDFYTFTSSGNNVTIDFTHINQDYSYSDFNIFLINSNKETMIQFDSDNGLNSTHQVGVVPEKKYFLLIEGNGSSAGGKYSFNIAYGNALFEIEPNNDFGLSNYIQEGLYYNGYSIGNKDFYKFTAKNNLTSLRFEHGQETSNSDFKIYLYDSQHMCLEVYYSYNGVDELFPFYVSSGDTYFFVIEGCGSSGDYGFVLE